MPSWLLLLNLRPQIYLQIYILYKCRIPITKKTNKHIHMYIYKDIINFWHICGSFVPICGSIFAFLDFYYLYFLKCQPSRVTWWLVLRINLMFNKINHKSSLPAWFKFSDKLHGTPRNWKACLQAALLSGWRSHRHSGFGH